MCSGQRAQAEARGMDAGGLKYCWVNYACVYSLTPTTRLRQHKPLLRSTFGLMMQAARESAQAEAEGMKAEVDAVVARQQSRVAEWEAAVSEEESSLAAKHQELQVCLLCFRSKTASKDTSLYLDLACLQPGKRHRAQFSEC